MKRPRDHFVLYEDLAAEPGPTVRRLLAGLGLAWEPAILTDYGAMAERLTVPRETWKRDVDRAIRPSSSTDSVLSADQKLWARRALRFDFFERLSAVAKERGLSPSEPDWAKEARARVDRLEAAS